jgi:hypothetical protein
MTKYLSALSSPTPPFPLYLLPSLPFRRRSSTSTNSTSPTSTPSSSPPQPTSYLTRNPTSHLRCHKCLTDLIPTSSIISKGFTGRHGRAYLVAPPTTHSWGSELGDGDLPNTFTHKPVPRQLVTGAHTVSDISCKQCGNVLGWKYVHAEEEGQRYKIGKFILETKRIVRGVDEWVDRGDDGRVDGMEEERDVQFDSEDEDECEDLFSGIWTKELAGKRRKNRAFGNRA